jgi:hypothetical protein
MDLDSGVQILSGKLLESTFICIKPQFHIMSELATNLMNQAGIANHVAAKDGVKHEKTHTNSIASKKNEITLKGGCLLSTKSEVKELLASNSISYALICKDALISLHDLQQSLPPIVADIL